MGSTPSSTSLFLPFGSLTGLIPVDAVGGRRVLGDFANVLEASAQRASDIQQRIHSAIDPFAPAVRGRRIEDER